jgi:hypothetical protein
MISAVEARARGWQQLTEWRPPCELISSQWGVIEYREWIVRESMRLDGYLSCEPVYGETAKGLRRVSIWSERRNWRNGYE